jgi:hypothetical protein
MGPVGIVINFSPVWSVYVICLNQANPAIPQENIMSITSTAVAGQHAAAWSLGRRATDRLFHQRILPGRYLDWEAWEAMTRTALEVTA